MHIRSKACHLLAQCQLLDEINYKLVPNRVVWYRTGPEPRRLQEHRSLESGVCSGEAVVAGTEPDPQISGAEAAVPARHHIKPSPVDTVSGSLLGS